MSNCEGVRILSSEAWFYDSISNFNSATNNNFEIRGGPWDGSKSHRRRFCHVEAYAWDFEKAQLQIGSKSRSRVKTPRWLIFPDLKLWDGSKFEAFNISNRVFVRILSYLRVLGLKKWAISEFWHVIEILSQFEVEPSQNLILMPPRDKLYYTSNDNFLSHLKDPRVRDMIGP